MNKVSMMEDERVTLRMGTSEVQAMDDYLLEYPELGTRSQFIRTALRAYMKRDGTSTPASNATESGIFVRFNPVQLSMLHLWKQRGNCFDEEEFIRNSAMNIILPKPKAEDLENIQTTAQQMVL
jgi:hypothetical protein